MGSCENVHIAGDLMNAIHQQNDYQCCEILFRSGLLSNSGVLLPDSLNVDYSANVRRAPDNATMGTQKVWKRVGNSYKMCTSECNSAGLTIKVTPTSTHSFDISVQTRDGDSFSYSVSSDSYSNSEPEVNRNKNSITFFFASRL